MGLAEFGAGGPCNPPSLAVEAIKDNWINAFALNNVSALSVRNHRKQLEEEEALFWLEVADGVTGGAMAAVSIASANSSKKKERQANAASYERFSPAKCLSSTIIDSISAYKVASRILNCTPSKFETVQCHTNSCISYKQSGQCSTLYCELQ